MQNINYETKYNYEGSYLDGTDLDGTDLDGADLDGTDLDKVITMRNYEYREIHNTICSMAPSICQFAPDIIIAIGGGGFIPARMLRSHLKKVPILAVTMEAYDDNTNSLHNESNVIIHQWFDITKGHGTRVPGGRVVIVDEVDDTRLTLSKCIETLRDANPAAIAVAVVHNKIKPKKGILSADILYVAGENVEDIWLNYPWDNNLLI